MRSATRPGVHVDRAACAWLIRRFVDPTAEFIFAADPSAIPGGATPFDMRGAALGHHRGRCSFETALAAFDLTADPAPEEIGRIVHEADLADERYDAPAAPGLDVLIRGLTLTSDSDQDTLAVTDRLFDGLTSTPAASSSPAARPRSRCTTAPWPDARAPDCQRAHAAHRARR